MSISFNYRYGSLGDRPHCLDTHGCREGVCPDFIIRRHDTKPALKIAIDDCDGPMDFTGLVIEANMWAVARLKANIGVTDTYFALADGIGFEQMLVGDIIMMQQVRMPEQMLVTGFDEQNKLVQVQRGYHGTTPQPWKRGARMKIFRLLNGIGEVEMTYENVQQVDGTTSENELSSSHLVYEWQPEDTCLPGCYYLEFKVLKMIDAVYFLPGGHWIGPTHTQIDGYTYTGSVMTDSSVRLSYDPGTNFYLIPASLWSGESHLGSDGNYHTGSVQNDGSVFLTKTGIALPNSVAFNADSGPTNTIWYLQGGYWGGPICIGPNEQFYTGSSYTDSSALLYVNQANGMYSVANKLWSGPFHSYYEGVYYTGTIQTDGSVVLEQSEIPMNGGFSSDTSPSQVNLVSFNLFSGVSIIPSFTDEGLTPYYFSCVLGEGVEWVRRFPMTGEGFVIHIVDSPTAEL